MASTLSGTDKATYDSIFRHPVAHNLEWRSLTAVLSHLGELEEEPNGKLKFSRNGQTLTLHTRGKDVDVEEVMHIRHFLESSEDPTKQNAAPAMDVLVVLDHAGARIFRGDASEAKAEHVVPLDPSGHDQQVHNPKGDSGGKQGPLRHLFYEALAQHLENADRILLIGDGQGASSETEHFMAEIQQHHHLLAARVVGNETANITHMSDADFVAKAREFFAVAPRS